MNTDRRLLAAAFLAITFFTAGPARAAVNHPTQIAPAAGTTAEFLPAFAWTPVPNADKYEFQIAADPGMNSGVLGGGKDDFFTKNTRGTLQQTVPNGTYYWRVRAVGVDGSVSAWSAVWSFTKQWDLQPAKQTPGDGRSLTFPANPPTRRSPRSFSNTRTRMTRTARRTSRPRPRPSPPRSRPASTSGA